MLFLAMMLAAIAGEAPPLPPPPKPEPDPDSRIRLSDASGREVILDGVEWQIGVDHATSPPTTAAIRVSNVEDTATVRLRPVPNREPLFPPARPWAPSRRVADPQKKRARKAQKMARRAGR